MCRSWISWSMRSASQSNRDCMTICTCWLVRIVLIDIRSAEPEEDMSQRSMGKAAEGHSQKIEEEYDTWNSRRNGNICRTSREDSEGLWKRGKRTITVLPLKQMGVQKYNSEQSRHIRSIWRVNRNRYENNTCKKAWTVRVPNFLQVFYIDLEVRINVMCSNRIWNCWILQSTVIDNSSQHDSADLVNIHCRNW